MVQTANVDADLLEFTRTFNVDLANGDAAFRVYAPPNVTAKLIGYRYWIVADVPSGSGAGVVLTVTDASANNLITAITIDDAEEGDPGVNGAGTLITTNTDRLFVQGDGSPAYHIVKATRTTLTSGILTIELTYRKVQRTGRQSSTRES